MSSAGAKPSPSKEEASGKEDEKPKDAAAAAAPGSPPREDSAAAKNKDSSNKLDNTPTTEPLSPAHSRATGQESGAFQHVLNPYYHYQQQGTPPPPSPGTYDIHAMLLQQQAAMGASPYNPGQTYSGGMPPPPPLSPGQNTASNNSNSAAANNAAAAHMVSPLMSPVTYGMNPFDQSNTGEAVPNSPPLYLGQQAVPNSPVASYAGIYSQYGSSSPGGVGTAKWAGT